MELAGGVRETGAALSTGGGRSIDAKNVVNNRVGVG